VKSSIIFSLHFSILTILLFSKVNEMLQFVTLGKVFPLKFFLSKVEYQFKDLKYQIVEIRIFLKIALVF